MENVHLMALLKPSCHLNQNFPNFILFEHRLLFLMLANALKQVPVVAVFHDDAKIKSEQVETYQRDEEASSMKASL